MANRDIVAIGTSAGGVEALLFLAQRFSSNFPATILITIHLPSEIRSSLDEILSHAGPLPATLRRAAKSFKKHTSSLPPRNGICLSMASG
jgi:two-component system chemotaxis response regulator CheB